jgi:ATP-dependent DNA ligase
MAERSSAHARITPGKAKRTVAQSQKSDFALPLETAPMEARTEDTIPDEPGLWQYEPKWDGFRCLAFKEGDAVELRAKSGKPLGRYFPDIVSMLRELAATRFVLDGEIVIEDGGEYSFEALQLRLHPAESRVRKLASETPAQFVVFDMLAGPDGKSLLDEPLTERRKVLEQFFRLTGHERLILSRHTTAQDEAERWLRGSGSGSTDGIVAKLIAGPYRPGERAMVKVKRLRAADCVVGGFRYLSAGAEVGSLLLGLYDDDGKLHHVGFTSTIAKEDRAALTVKLEALREPPGFTGRAPGGPSRWSTERTGEWEPLRPELVVEVCFDHVTGDRFRHGTKFLRWRPDKKPSQCTFEQMRQ